MDEYPHNRFGDTSSLKGEVRDYREPDVAQEPDPKDVITDSYGHAMFLISLAILAMAIVYRGLSASHD